METVATKVGPEHFGEFLEVRQAEKDNVAIPEEGELAKAAREFMRLVAMDKELEKWEKNNGEIPT
jgi:3-methyladenine DNA glycosylase/8-oxoguanine DNA glycosylase